jgi:hypothetical protein
MERNLFSPTNRRRCTCALYHLLPVRVERVMRRDGLSRAQAERRVREEDQRRANAIRQFYHADWHAPDPFDLILNTALWDEEACIRLVLAAVAERTWQSSGESNTQPRRKAAAPPRPPEPAKRKGGRRSLHRLQTNREPYPI